MVSLDFSIGKVFVGSVSAPIELQGSDGAVQLHGANGPILRPLTVLERLQTLRNAQNADDSQAAQRLASETLQRATQTPDTRTTQQADDKAIAKAVALHLAGADIPAPGLKQALTLVSQHFGWQPSEIWNSPAAQFDQIAASLTPATHSDWNQLIMLDPQENALDALVNKLADDFLKRELNQASNQASNQSVTEDVKEDIATNLDEQKNRTSPNTLERSNQQPLRSNQQETQSSRKTQSSPATFELNNKSESPSKPLHEARPDTRNPTQSRDSKNEATKALNSSNKADIQQATQTRSQNHGQEPEELRPTENKKTNANNRMPKIPGSPLVIQKLEAHEDFSAQFSPTESQSDAQKNSENVSASNVQNHTQPQSLPDTSGTEKESTQQQSSQTEPSFAQRQSEETLQFRQAHSSGEPSPHQPANRQASNVFPLPEASHRKADKTRSFSQTPEADLPLSAKDFFGSSGPSSEFALDQFFESSTLSVAEELAELLNREADQRGID